MKYLCLVYLSEAKLAAMSPAEQKALDKDSAAYDADLQRRGIFVAAEALQSVQSAVSLRRIDDRLSRTDGPYVETKEHLGGFILIDVRDLEEAVEIASKIPVSRYGGVEVRPIYNFQ
jgi:hypothetical protein